LAEKPKVAYMPPPSPKEKAEKPGVIPSYWEDVIRKKAELEALLDDLNKELLDSKSKIAELDKMNKELSLRIDQLSKDKDRLEKDLTFKERTLQIMSKDLVSEKERRKDVSDELEMLRDENMQLKQEMIVANDAKLKLQEELKSSSRRRETLEERVSEIEKVLKEKSMVFEQLKDELVSALGTPVGELPQEMPEVEEETHAPTSSAVELPPIVVKPQEQQLVTAQSTTGGMNRQKLTGSILAVNARENFVIVDLGEDSGLNPGMQLDVFRGGKHIGIIEVIETRKEISAADITSMGIGDSIKEGDSVISK
jgi:myosin heavy subunit